MDTDGRVDRLDAALLSLLDEQPRTSVLDAARRLGVARGTVQARLDRLQRDGVIRGFGPDIDPAAVGYPVTAFCSVEIRQSAGAAATTTTHAAVAGHLADVAEVLEVHTVTGAADLLVRVVARSNADLQRVIDRILESPHVVRLSTTIALATPLPYRCMPLVRAAVAGPGPGTGPVAGRQAGAGGNRPNG